MAEKSRKRQMTAQPVQVYLPHPRCLRRVQRRVMPRVFFRGDVKPRMHGRMPRRGCRQNDWRLTNFHSGRRSGPAGRGENQRKERRKTGKQNRRFLPVKGGKMGEPAQADLPSTLSPCMVLVLCGLPGAGKSTLARRLMQRSGGGHLEVHHLSFDDIFFGDESSADVEQFDASKWRLSREQALLQVEHLIQDSLQPDGLSPYTPSLCDGTPTLSALAGNRLIVVDDNMHYRSMRRQCFQVAKKCTFPLS
jgi:hypothetical protein